MSHILHIIADLSPSNGIAVTLKLLSHELAATHRQTIVTRRRPWNTTQGIHPDIELNEYNLPQLFCRLSKHINAADIVHIHGAWTPPVWLGSILARLKNKKIVYSPHGSFAPVQLQHSRFKKTISALIFERPLVHSAKQIHIASKNEKEWTHAFLPSVTEDKMTLIPWGIKPITPQPHVFNPPNTILCIARLHPLKGLKLLIDAWKQLEKPFPNHRLLIAGNGTASYQTYLQMEIHQSNLIRVTLQEPVYDEAKAQMLSTASCLILPSFSENFGLVVGEALACGTPVVTTRVGPWGDVEKKGCGWLVEPTVESIAEGLCKAMQANRETLLQMGARGKAWIETDFRWSDVAQQMSRLYENLLNESEH